MASNPTRSFYAEESSRGAVWIVENSSPEAEFAARALSESYSVEVLLAPPSIERLSRERPSVLLLGFSLQGTTGSDLCRSLRSSWDSTALPILMLTSAARKEQITEALSAGANDHLGKPYAAEELVLRTAVLARTRSLHDQLEVQQEKLRSVLDRSESALTRAEQADRIKDDFLSVVSHELRTPLNAITGWLHLLQRGIMSDEKRQHAFSSIDRNVRAQTQLIDDLLDVSRISSGRLALRVEPLDVRAVVERAVEAVQPSAEAKGVTLLSRLRTGAPLMGDAKRLEQVVWNLLTNAVKFTPAGGVIELDLKQSDDEIELTVQDTGQGVAADFLPRIFDLFLQADTKLTRAQRGLGLGLALVRSLVELHGGTVTAASGGQGRGTTFLIRLPATPGVILQPAPAASAASRMELERRLRGRKVLVVEDDFDSREVLVKTLEQYGVDVSWTSNARDALRELEAWQPDLLLSDIGMPNEDGFSLIRRVRALPSNTGGSTPAVALTAFALDDERHGTIKAGFDRHLTKPVNVNELVAVLASLI